jgi:hypothetical protein
MEDFPMASDLSAQEVFEKTLAALVDRLGGHVVLSTEEIEDAPDVEVRSLFDTDTIELRTPKGKLENRHSLWVTNAEEFEGNNETLH